MSAPSTPAPCRLVNAVAETQPVSTTCETWTDDRVPCGAQAVRGYQAWGGGYHMMCEVHAQYHLDYCVTLEQAQRGEKPDYPKAKP